MASTNPDPQPTGLGYCKKCRKNKPLDDFAIIKSESMDICETCYARFQKRTK